MLYILGYPADCGGANVELFATVKLWRVHGVEVTLIPTWSARQEWRDRLDAIGCKTLIATPETLNLPKDSTVVSFGNYHMLQTKLPGCRLIFVPCATVPDNYTTIFHQAGKRCDEYIFQSKYQYDYCVQALRLPVTNCHQIPGAFDLTEFPFNPLPHKRGQPFWCGRISRPDVLKFSPFLWNAYDPVPNIRARIMGWSGSVARHCGSIVPGYATVLEKRSESAREFYPHLHAIIHPGGKAVENWPRFVLEAMASGVPVITDKQGGLVEMILGGTSGFLCKTVEEMANAATTLEKDEEYRMFIAKRARKAVEDLSDADMIWKKWEPLFKWQ